MTHSSLNTQLADANLARISSSRRECWCISLWAILTVFQAATRLLVCPFVWCESLMDAAIGDTAVSSRPIQFSCCEIHFLCVLFSAWHHPSPPGSLHHDVSLSSDFSVASALSLSAARVHVMEAGSRGCGWWQSAWLMRSRRSLGG